MKTVFVAAGEASGDLHAAALIRALQARSSGLSFFGLGGDQMRAAGVDLLYDLRALAVAGFWEVAKRLRHFRKIYHDTLREIDLRKPDLAILVDYPGMNLRLARGLTRRGIPVVYYIAPQVWAWKPGRIKQIEERVDLLLSILPFEKKLFNPARIKCEFVGHPLLDLIGTGTDTQVFRQRHNIREGSKIIALLPGSRAVEVVRHYRTMLETAERLQREGFDLAPFVAVREELGDALYAETERATGVTPARTVADRYDLLQSASVSLIASGTATLEAALCGRPFCVVYKTGWITYQIAKRVINLNNVGLVNIIAEETIVPELLQSEMSVRNLAGFCREIFTHDAVAETMINKLRTVRSRLGEPGATERAAELIAREYLR